VIPFHYTAYVSTCLTYTPVLLLVYCFLQMRWKLPRFILCCTSYILLRAAIEVGPLIASSLITSICECGSEAKRVAIGRFSQGDLKSLNEASNGPVILSAAKNLSPHPAQILRCAQNDRANLTTFKSPWRFSALTCRSQRQYNRIEPALFFPDSRFLSGSGASRY